MKIVIQTRDLELTDDLRQYIENRLGFALSSFKQRIRSVVVRLSDINGPKGGIDKRCQMGVRLKGLTDVVVEETEANFHVAVNRAADRAKRVLGRRLQRAHSVFTDAHALRW